MWKIYIQTDKRTDGRTDDEWSLLDYIILRLFLILWDHTMMNIDLVKLLGHILSKYIFWYFPGKHSNQICRTLNIHQLFQILWDFLKPQKFKKVPQYPNRTNGWTDDGQQAIRKAQLSFTLRSGPRPALLCGSSCLTIFCIFCGCFS